MLKNVSKQLKKPPPEFSVLDDVIDTLRFRGSIFFHSNLAAPWGISMSSIKNPRFHIALEGSFYIGTGAKPVNVSPMDIVMIPNGEMHWIADQVDRELVTDEQSGDACSLGTPLFQKGTITNRIMCGLIEYEELVTHPFTSVLPSIIHLDNIHPEHSIWMAVKLIDEEIRRTNNLKNSIIDRLTEVLFIKLLNKFVNENKHLTGFLAALKEPSLHKILQLIHKYPEKQWTLEKIGEVVGMSRATVQRKFKDRLGVSPIMYLSSWRMAKAYQMLKHSNLTLERIADAIGYSDSHSFRTAFKRHYGFTPSSLRGK